MVITGDREADLPSLTALGRDLLQVSRAELAWSFLRPLLCFALFWLCALTHLYLLACVAVAALLFFTYTSTSHDLVHRTLPLPPACNEIALAILEAICLRSGHAFRLTHLHHHKRFPHDDDIEGADAARGLWPALACGPFHQARLFRWAWQHGHPRERRWMAIEASFSVCVIVAAVFAWRTLPELSLYVLLVVLGSWLFPLATVWWPHRAEGRTALQHTRAFRGRLIPWLFFQHTYHLEHHLYPGVSSHRWGDLGRRLEPYLVNAGVRFLKLP